MCACARVRVAHVHGYACVRACVRALHSAGVCGCSRVCVDLDLPRAGVLTLARPRAPTHPSRPTPGAALVLFSATAIFFLVEQYRIEENVILSRSAVVQNEIIKKKNEAMEAAKVELQDEEDE